MAVYRKKTRYLGIFPKPGVSEKDITDATRFSRPILESLQNENFSDLQQKLVQLGAVNIKSFLIVADKRANILFAAWAKLISKKGSFTDKKRLKWVKLFNIYLLIAIWLLMPIVFIIYLLTYPFMLGKYSKFKKYYKSVNYKKEN